MSLYERERSMGAGRLLLPKWPLCATCMFFVWCCGSVYLWLLCCGGACIAIDHLSHPSSSLFVDSAYIAVLDGLLHARPPHAPLFPIPMHILPRRMGQAFSQRACVWVFFVSWGADMNAQAFRCASLPRTTQQHATNSHHLGVYICTRP